MKHRIFYLTLFALLSVAVHAQTKADSLRVDSIYKSMELQGVEVVKQKSLVKADIDKITYDIENDPDSKSNTVIEMLRKVPMVTVDGEDNIQVNGSSSFKVYVNGKPNNMMSNNPKEVLKSMPANSIKKIEVITNPGPKYDAEGVGGILNIITHGSGLEGYTATLSGTVGNQSAGGGAYGTVKAGKLTVSANYNLNYNFSPRSYSGGSRKTIGTINASSSDLAYNGSSKSHGTFQYGSFEASYEIDTLRLVTASFGLWGGADHGNSDMATLAVEPVNRSMLYGYQTASHSRNAWSSIDGGIDYQRSFPVKDRLLTLSYKINTNPRSSDSYTDYLDKQSDTAWDNFIERLRNQHNDGSQRSTEHTFQLDYTTPFAKQHTVEAGVKYILRNNRSENDRYELEQFDQDHSSHYKHRNDILAAYVGYGVKVKKWSGRLGLRYEHTLQDVTYELGRGSDFRRHFNDLVPSASIGWKVGKMSKSWRRERPGWHDIRLRHVLSDAHPYESPRSACREGDNGGRQENPRRRFLRDFRSDALGSLLLASGKLWRGKDRCSGASEKDLRGGRFYGERPCERHPCASESRDGEARFRRSTDPRHVLFGGEDNCRLREVVQETAAVRSIFRAGGRVKTENPLSSRAAS